MHNLEHLLVVLSARIRTEANNDELAEAALSLASASHSYIPEPGADERLAEWNDEWAHHYGDLIHLRQDHAAAKDVLVNLAREHGQVTWKQVKAAMKKAGLIPSTFAIWNAVKEGSIRRPSRGVYEFVG